MSDENFVFTVFIRVYLHRGDQMREMVMESGTRIASSRSTVYFQVTVEDVLKKNQLNVSYLCISLVLTEPRLDVPRLSYSDKSMTRMP